MLDIIEKLLVLQDRDRKLLRTQAELSGVEPQRQSLQTRATSARAALDAAKLRVKQFESDRKKLELDVEAKKELIAKYSVQQLQTKKNEEYRALAHEIEMCREAIAKIEDQELELMLQADDAQKTVVETSRAAQAAQKECDSGLATLAELETNLRQQLAELQANRGELAAAVEESTLARYERLLKQRGDNVVVGVEHGCCGGCHMRLPTQVLVSCRGDTEVNACPHCGRILYFTRDMEMAVAD
ncbi:MAG: hypothetical protein HY300_16080 [Verrucomicrobia bacterium]|nr:hypothetical protein [Verrucomicrobiota bacterium]